VEQQLSAGLGEGQITKFVENDDVEARHIIGESSLAAGARLGLKPVDEIDGGEEAAARPGADAASRDGDRQMRLAGSRQTSVILPGVRRLRFGSPIGFIRGRGILSQRWASVGMQAPIIS
jgi:hypothetical protein